MSDTNDVTLVWDDPNMIEKGHRIYRSSTSMDVDNMPKPIANINKDETMYIDRDQPVGVTNFYRVSAWIDGYEAISNEFAIVVPPLRYLYATSQDGAVYRLTDQGDEMWGDINLTHDYSQIAVDSSGDLIVVYDSTITKFAKSGGKVWDYSVPSTIQGITVDLDRNIYLAHDSIVQQVTINGEDGWRYTHSEPINTIAYDILKGYIYIGDATGIHVTDGESQVASHAIGEVQDIIPDRANMVYYRQDNILYRYDLTHEVMVTSVTLGSDILDWVVGNDNTVYVSTSSGIAKLNVENSDAVFLSDYNDAVSLDVNGRGEILLAQNNAVVKVGSDHSQLWQHDRSSPPQKVNVYEGSGFMEPSDLDFAYRHFYEPVELEFHSS